jgi:hypothetical protein
MSTRNNSYGVKAAGAYGWQPYRLHMPTVMKSGCLNLLKSPGPIKGLLYLLLQYSSLTLRNTSFLTGPFELTSITTFHTVQGDKYSLHHESRNYSLQEYILKIWVFIVQAFGKSCSYIRCGKWCRTVFLNRRAAARYRALASIIPGRER